MKYALSPRIINRFTRIGLYTVAKNRSTRCKAKSRSRGAARGQTTSVVARRLALLGCHVFKCCQDWVLIKQLINFILFGFFLY